MNQLSMMLLEDQLPDIIYNNTLATYTTINQYGDEGYFLNFKDHLDVMPNFKKLLEDYPDYAAFITSPSGAIYSMSRVNPAGIVMDDSKAQINITWLKNVGKEIPTTLDELYDVLCAFRDQDANGNGDPSDEIPLSYCNASAGSYRFEWNIRAAFGIYSDQRSYCLQADDNQQLYVAETTEAYKNFLKYMHKLYTDGLLDSETYIQTNDEFRAKLTEDIIGYGNDSSTMSLKSGLARKTGTTASPSSPKKPARRHMCWAPIG
jgi:putative aldouronate transport system substrate-binding protein